MAFKRITSHTTKSDPPLIEPILTPGQSGQSGLLAA